MGTESPKAIKATVLWAYVKNSMETSHVSAVESERGTGDRVGVGVGESGSDHIGP
jgi:hypothetical protein